MQELYSDLRSRFLGGMSHAACTVNVVSTDGPAGRAGVTVSAMASVSADTERPTLLVCIHHRSAAAAAIIGNGVLCVNVLRDDQAYISDAFAGRFKEELGDKFHCTDWIACASGAPRIADPLVAFDCSVVSGERVGTHHIFLCEVLEVHLSKAGSPLIYANRAYGSPVRIEGVQSLRAAVAGQAATLTVGCFHTFGPYVMPGLIRRLQGVALRLVEGDQRRLSESLAAGESEVALLYDLELDGGLATIPLATLAPHVLLPTNHPLASQAEIAPVELAEIPMVLLDAPPSRDYFTGLMADAGVKPLIAYRSASFEMVRGLVGHGLGYAILATKPASDMTYDGMQLVVRPLAGSHRVSRIVLAHLRARALSPAAERFVALCRKHFDSSGLGARPDAA